MLSRDSDLKGGGGGEETEGKIDMGVDLVGLRQTAGRLSQAALIDPSLAGPRLQTAATCLYQNNTTGVTAKESRHGPAPALPHASIDTPPSPVLPSQAIRCRAHLATRVCCRYQERTQCCLSSQTPGYAPQKPLHG